MKVLSFLSSLHMKKNKKFFKGLKTLFTKKKCYQSFQSTIYRCKKADFLKRKSWNQSSEEQIIRNQNMNRNNPRFVFIENSVETGLLIHLNLLLCSSFHKVKFYKINKRIIFLNQSIPYKMNIIRLFQIIIFILYHFKLYFIICCMQKTQQGSS